MNQVPADTYERVEAVMAEARVRETQPWHPRFSSAGDCRRRLVYEAMEAKAGRWPLTEERPVRWNAAAECGTAIGDMLERAAARLGARVQVPALITGAQFGATFDVPGTADVVWDDAVWDWKCVGGYAFKLAKSNPDPKHVTQVQGYAAAEGKPRWALVYIDLGSIGRGEHLPFLVHEGDTPPEAAERIMAIWQDVDDHVTDETLPERGFEQLKCENIKCGFLESCWRAE